MNKDAVAFRVLCDYGFTGATDLYVVQRQDPTSLNWKIAHGVSAFDLGGYELKGWC